MSPQTEVIDMRTPATAPIPVQRPEPTWDQVVQAKRPRKKRVRGRSMLGEWIQAGAYALLAGWLFGMASRGELTAVWLGWGTP